MENKIKVTPDVIWTVCPKCMLRKVKGLPTEVDTTRTCSNEEQQNCHSLADRIVVSELQNEKPKK